MASLAELLNPKSKKSTTIQNGQIARTSNEELNSLAQKSNLQAAPTTPLGAQMLGAGPDVAKMAGSAQQKQAAVRQSIQESESLATQERQKQVRKEQTEQERQEQERAKNLEGLGSLGSRVQELTKKMLSAQSQQQPQQSLIVNEDAISKSGVAPENQQQFRDVLGKLTSGTATNEDVQVANQLMGRNATTLLSPEQLKEMFGTVAQQVGSTVTGAVANDVQLGNLDQNQVQSLGFNNLDEMAQVLNVPPNDLGTMTVNQLQDKINQIKSGEYQKTQTLQRQSSDPNLGAAERKEARALLREAGAVGIRAADEDVADLAQQIDEADTVTFNGQQMSVQQLLSDENLNGTIQRFLDDPNYKSQLEKEEPQFADWLKANETAVKQMMDKVDPAVKQYNQLQAERAGAAKTAQGTTLSNDLMKMVYNDWGSLGTTAYDQSKEPEALKILKSESADPTVRANLEDFLNEAAKSEPALARAVMDLSRQELASLGVFDKGGRGLQDYLDYSTSIKAASNAQTPEEFMSSVFGTNLREAQQLIDQARSLKNLGINVPNLELFDSDGDGKVDSLDKLKANVVGPGKTFNPDTSPRGLLNAGKQLSDLPKGGQLMGSLTDILNKTDADTKALAKYTKDGSFDDRDALDIVGSESLESLQKILANPNINLGPGRQRLEEGVRKKVQDVVVSAVPNYQQALSDVQAVRQQANTPLKFGEFNQGESDRQKQSLSQALSSLQTSLQTAANPTVRSALQSEINNVQDSIGKLNSREQRNEQLKSRASQEFSKLIEKHGADAVNKNLKQIMDNLIAKGEV